MKRLTEIEGLRAYLALWVLIGHCLQLSGYSGDGWSGVLLLLREANYAVDIFMLISGFVIFYLIDNKKENYRVFIIRRFFRLWPLFIVTLAVSLPVSVVAIENFSLLKEIYPGAEIDTLIKLFNGGWEAPIKHIFAHATMLHGAIPEQILSGSPTAFLPPAWSISLEWQFYLFAPICFWAFSSSAKSRAILAAVAIVGYIVSRKYMHVHMNAFLPMHVEYFFFGCVSYFIYQYSTGSHLRVKLFTVGVAISVFLLLISQTINMVPLCFWIPFCCLLIDRHNHKHQGVVSWLFNNRAARYLGAISYSIYLSHILVIVLVQYLILKFMGDIPQNLHFVILALSTLFLTVLVSSFLFLTVERNGMLIGRRLADKLATEDRGRIQLRPPVM